MANSEPRPLFERRNRENTSDFRFSQSTDTDPCNGAEREKTLCRFLPLGGKNGRAAFADQENTITAAIFIGDRAML